MVSTLTWQEANMRAEAAAESFLSMIKNFNEEFPDPDGKELLRPINATLHSEYVGMFLSLILDRYQIDAGDQVGAAAGVALGAASGAATANAAEDEDDARADTSGAAGAIGGGIVGGAIGGPVGAVAGAAIGGGVGAGAGENVEEDMEGGDRTTYRTTDTDYGAGGSNTH